MTSVWALAALWLGLALITALLSIWLHTPFYFIRAGSFVSIPALMAASFAFVFMLIEKIICKLVGVYPVMNIIIRRILMLATRRSSPVRPLPFAGRQ